MVKGILSDIEQKRTLLLLLYIPPLPPQYTPPGDVMSSSFRWALGTVNCAHLSLCISTYFLFLYFPYFCIWSSKINKIQRCSIVWYNYERQLLPPSHFYFISIYEQKSEWVSCLTSSDRCLAITGRASHIRWEDNEVHFILNQYA